MKIDMTYRYVDLIISSLLAYVVWCLVCYLYTHKVGCRIAMGGCALAVSLTFLEFDDGSESLTTPRNSRWITQLTPSSGKGGPQMVTDKWRIHLSEAERAGTAKAVHGVRVTPTRIWFCLHYQSQARLHVELVLIKVWLSRIMSSACCERRAESVLVVVASRASWLACRALTSRRFASPTAFISNSHLL